ncbi:vicilin-like seed storage protein At2g28490 [Aristolochia californica]|uniref:vicilin-like seed storage protein At2g28490 n=1 Tax=Aristolochia californica TaxID=171875 RepID=UPI0035DBFACC
MAILGRNALLLLLLVCCISVCLAVRGRGEEEEVEEEHQGGKGGLFMLEKPKQVLKSEGGEFKVFRGFRRGRTATPMHIGFINMEPSTLFIPQYIDSSLILFVRRGEMRIGWIYKDDLVEKQLKIGDVYRIPPGSAFYIVNTGRGQRLQIICSIDRTESLGGGIFQSFFIGGGTNLHSVLAGFDIRNLATAFNVSEEELTAILERPKGGPFIYMRNPDQARRWADLMKLNHEEMRAEIARDENDDEDSVRDEEQTTMWSWRKLLNAFIGIENKKKRISAVKAPDSYNLYERGPDFRNNYGWSVAVSEHDYSPLRSSGIGVYLVNLTAGSMMAPHLNPTATEYGVVLRGSGSIQVVFPNGTSAMNAKVQEGDVFWIPRYYPFCQIASRSGPMEFFGYTTSSRRNRPQFLAGRSSILQTMAGEEMAMALDISLKRYNRFRGSQKEEIILPELLTRPETTTEPEIIRKWGEIRRE